MIKKFIKKYINYRIINFLRDRKKFFSDLKQDIDSLNGKYKYKYNIIFIAGMPKSGTTRLENFLALIPGYVSRPLYGDIYIILEQNLPQNAFKYFDDNLYSYVKTHLNPLKENLDILDQKKIAKKVITYRDLRDIAVSRYFHLLKSPKKKSEPNSEVNYNNMTKEDALLHSLKIVKEQYVPWIEGWLELAERDKENYLVMRYEDILENPVNQFKLFTDFYDLKLTLEEIKYNLNTVDLEMKQGFSLHKTVGKKSTFRNGKAGDWKNHFTQVHLDYIEKELQTTLEKIGYTL